MAAVNNFPEGTLLRYKACGSQPRRTFLVLRDGQLKCLRVGDETRKGGKELPTYSSLAAFLDTVPAQDGEEFIVQWPFCYYGSDAEWDAAKLTMEARGYERGTQQYAKCILPVALANRDAGAKRYLESLGLKAGDDIFYRVPPVKPKWDESIYSPAGYYYDDEPLTEDEHALAKASWDYHQKHAAQPPPFKDWADFDATVNKALSLFTGSPAKRRVQPARVCKKTA